VADTAYVLNKDDLDKLKETMAYVDSIRRNKSRSQDSYDSEAPDLYIARVPAAGIAALTTGTTADKDKASKTVCQVYQIIADEVNGTTPEMMIVNDTTIDVYNVFAVAITGNSWVPVSKDKYGMWVVTGIPSSSSSSPTLSTFHYSIYNPGSLGSGVNNYITLAANTQVNGIATVVLKVTNPPSDPASIIVYTALNSAPTSYLTASAAVGTPDVPRPGTGVNFSNITVALPIFAILTGAGDQLIFSLPGAVNIIIVSISAILYTSPYP
jgi:hypothetical protein